MLNKDNIRKWVEALRSGQYKQGKGRLAHENNEFCCLGVACEVAIREGVPVTKGMSYIKGILYDGTQTSLPRSVQTWLGVDVHIGAHSAFLHALMKLNDIEGSTFPQIADYIEKEILNESDRQS